MTKKTHIIYSLISICAIIAYGGFIVKSSISPVDTVEETLPYEEITEAETEEATEVIFTPISTVEAPTEEPTETATVEELKGFSPLFPVEGTITKPFSLTHSYVPETRDWRAHSGIDIASLPAEAVISVEDGLVTKCCSDPLWGNVIEISHGEYTSIYKNLSTLIMVKEGDSVNRGEKISGVGNTATCEPGEAHLHFELKHYSDFVNHMDYLS